MSTPLDPSYYLHLAQARRSAKAGFIKRGSGDRAAVKALQTRLSNVGLQVSTDGVFGPETEKALREFQKTRGARVDGVVGPETLGKLIRAHKPEGNDADPSIDAIQKVVGAGAPQTETAGRGLGNIKAEQRGGGAFARDQAQGRRTGTTRSSGAGREPKGAHGGAIDPVTGKETATAKTGPIGSTKLPTGPSNASFEDAHPRGGVGSPEGGRFVKKGDAGEDVENTQKAVNRVQGTKLKEDGAFGPKTERAVKAYQKRAGLVADGIVGPKTSASLRRRLSNIRRSSSRQGQARRTRIDRPPTT